MSTINEIAALAGVSKSTVSRVLNNSGYVSPHVRSRVEQIIHEKNYAPSALAVNLSKGETRTIGVLVPELDNAFFSEILKGIVEISDKNGFSIICCDTQNSAKKEANTLQHLMQQRIRGLIITPAEEYASPKDVTRLEGLFAQLNVPIVVVDRHLDKIQLDGVYYENVESGYLAAKTLIDAGNKRLGIITGDLTLRIARDRYQGARQAILDAGLTLEDPFVFQGDFRVSTAYQLSAEMFRRGVYPEAIITSSNRTSLGFLRAAHEYKVDIGKDIAVIGIDGIEVLDILDYKFSCVTRDVYEMGRTAMHLLLARIADKKTPYKTQSIPCQVVLRGSERRTP